MNLSSGQAASQGWDSGAGDGLGTVANTGPAHPGYTVGSVGFGPAWSTEDSMAASIVRLEGELTRARDTVLKLRRQRAVIDELRAEVALLREERAILQKTLSGGGERLNPRIPGSEPGAVRREARSVEQGREADPDHDSRGRVRPAQLLETVAFLRTYNRWRRGDDSIPQPQPGKAGEMIDAACDMIEQLIQQRDEAREMAEELLEKNAKQAVEIVRLKEAQ